MTLIQKLIERFGEFGYRHTYVDSALDSFIATQIKVLREQRDLTQTELAELASMKQSQISRLENINNSSWKVGTLRKLAHAFDLALVVRFENFGRALPDIDRFSRTYLQRDSFKDDPVFALTAATGNHQSSTIAAPEIQQAFATGRILRFVRPHAEHFEVTTQGTTGGSLIGQEAIAR